MMMTKGDVGIGEVVEHLTEWSRGRARRAGWNGKSMFLYYCPGLNSEDGFVMMRTARGSYIPWLCSQADLLADDWELFVGDQDEPRENP